jgi:hypothetical protein
MADLTTLNPAFPAGSDPIGTGDEAIRDTRDTVRGSFGGTDSGYVTAPEHYWKGFHAFPNGHPSFRPVAGNPGRLFFDTSNWFVELDNGVTWEQAHGVKLLTTWDVVPAAITGTPTTFASIVAPVRSNSNIAYFAAVMITPLFPFGFAGGYIILRVDGVNQYATSFSMISGVSNIYLCFPFLLLNPGLSQANHTFDFQVAAHIDGTLQKTQAGMALMVI